MAFSATAEVRSSTAAVSSWLFGTRPSFAASSRLRCVGASVFSSDDAKEGSRAFAEKRSPQWSGR